MPLFFFFSVCLFFPLSILGIESRDALALSYNTFPLYFKFLDKV